MGLIYKDIIKALAVEHGVVISLRHLKRILREMGLFRRKNYSNIGDVVEFVHSQMAHSGQLHGYRWMHEKCLAHNLHCKKEDVRVILGHNLRSAVRIYLEQRQMISDLIM